MDEGEIILKKSTSNKYDLMLILYIILLVFGVLGDALQPIRIVTVLSFPFMLHILLTSNDFRKSNRYVLFLFIFWLIYGSLTLLWTVDIVAGSKELVYLFINFTSFLIIVFLSAKSNNPKKSVMKGWIILFLITVPIAFYELLTDIHLPMSVVESDYILKLDSEAFERQFASVTFGNLNGYNTILMYIFPMLLGSILSSTSKKLSVFLWVVLFVNIYILISNGSRGAILAAVIGLLVFIYFFLKNNKSTWILLFVFLFAVFLFFNYFSEIFELIIGRFESQGLSDDGRLEIIKGSIDAFSDSFLFGVGAGSLMPILYYVYNFDIAAAHNLFLEVGIQYGIITFILFMYFFVRLFRQQRLSNEIFVKNIVVGSLCMAPLTFTIDSGYILNPAVWVFLSSLYVISNPELNSKEYSL